MDEAIQQTYAEDPIFALQAWAPKENDSVERLQKYAQEKKGSVIEVPRIRQPDETPPNHDAKS